MSIANKLSYLNETREQIREGLNKLGGNISTSDTFRSYADKIEEIYDSMPKVEESDVESGTLEGTIKGGLDINLKGNTSQTGTPTPSTPIPINVVSGDNEVVVCGKNLFDKNGNLTNGYLKNDGTIQSASGFKVSDYIDVSQFSDITISGNSGQGEFNCFYDSSKAFISGAGSGSSTEKTYSVPNNAKYFRATISDSSLDEYQIESGSSSSQYEPYQSQTYPINLGELELCNIPDTTYQDYFTKNSDGQWCKYNAIGKVVLDGSEPNWNIDGVQSGLSYRSFYTSQLQNIILKECDVLCDRLTKNTNVYSQDVNGIYCNYAGMIRLKILDNSLTSVNALQTYLGSNNLTVYYVLNTPYLSLIEDNNLIEQLDNLEYAMSYEGTTNVNQTNNNLPFKLDIKAILDWRNNGGE